MNLSVNNSFEKSSWFHVEDFFKGYENLLSIDVSSQEIENVQQYNDNELREKIAKIIQKVDPNILYRESKKSHNGYEISDMELPVSSAQGEKILYMYSR